MSVADAPKRNWMEKIFLNAKSVIYARTKKILS